VRDELMQTDMEKVYRSLSWSEVQVHFLRTYADSTIRNKLIAELDRLTQKPGQPAQAYHEAYESLCQRVSYDGSMNVEAMERGYNGDLRRELSRHKASKKLQGDLVTEYKFVSRQQLASVMLVLEEGMHPTSSRYLSTGGAGRRHFTRAGTQPAKAGGVGRGHTAHHERKDYRVVDAARRGGHASHNNIQAGKERLNATGSEQKQQQPPYLAAAAIPPTLSLPSSTLPHSYRGRGGQRGRGGARERGGDRGGWRGGRGRGGAQQHSEDGRDTRRCYNCNESGHLIADCPSPHKNNNHASAGRGGRGGRGGARSQ
jgi:Zinc knuckle/Retrotransposon gag protein